LALQEYDLEITYIPGKQNIIGDTLTRYPRITDNREENKICINKIKLEKYSQLLCNDTNQLKDLQNNDKQIAKLIAKQSDNILIKNGIVFVKNENEWQIAIPEQMTRRLTWETHVSFGHPGRYKTFYLLKEICTFRNVHRIIKLWM